MSIKKIEINHDDIYLFFEERYSLDILKKVLDYLISQQLDYYYFYYNDSFSNYDISSYYENYPILKERLDIGCIEIKAEHIMDTTFMLYILNQYHYSLLYINSDPNFLRYSDYKYRVQRFPSNIGYILDMNVFSGYIHISKASDQPDWDLEKMGIPKELIIAEDTSQERQSGNILTIIKNIFTRLKQK